MTTAVAAMGRAAPKLCYSNSSHHQLLLKLTKKKLMSSPKFLLNTPNLSSNTTPKETSPIHASNYPREEEQEEEGQESSSTKNSNSISREDLDYLWKLGAGAVAGAALIKYGSILFPEITRPNILQALIMVSTPVILAIVLLARQSRKK
ncbi:uncharacterized protein LOC110626610 [Manihot esculenta]|uniref:Uncharacterized protein n=1 Tax=Manihot esculenta TaxID=3983 RepID=A0A2C9UZZ7_MANES|nr:uncharacterized protein LOC110626610 [Manihot esculenta]OAY36896.1 hypothetical protein MANES_11G058100v8 [Manihot esculenta]